MTAGFLTGLAQNVALLLSLTLLYSVVRPFALCSGPRRASLAAGVLFGLISIAAMHTPFVVAPGVLADARVIPILLAGPFGGVGAAAVAAAIAATYRGFLGGAGAVAGAGTIVTTGALAALVAHHWRGRQRDMRPVTFLTLGVALDAIVLAWAAALPDSDLVRRVLGAAVLPVGIFLPLGTLGLGMLLVHERRRHDERERLVLTQFALERVADALLWVDAEGRIVNVNTAAERLTGFARHELLARRIWDLQVGAGPAQWQTFWTTVRGGSRTTQTQYRRRDGTAVPVEASNDYLAHDGREWVSVFVRDVTDRRRLDAERIEQLQREHLLRRQAEEAAALKDQFLATLSHELRTPLTSILGYARLLSGGRITGSAATRALGVIERNAVAQTRIVDDLLDLSSIVLRTFRMQRGRVALGLVVEREVAAARADADAGSVALACTVPPGLPAVDGDAGRLQQMVRHLVANAIKFTPAGGRVDVALDAVEDAARLVVRDTGVGIEPSFRAHVFDRFRQADSSTTRPFGGLGVGLAIVRHVVEAHGGTVVIESDGPGSGTTVTVRVPVAAPDLHGVRVLVVDEEEETRDLAATVLSACGAVVTAAASAEQALAEARRRKPDVLVADLVLRDADGRALLERLRSLPGGGDPGPPAAALAARAGDEERRRALAAGFDAHVPKPLQPGHLARVVAVLARRTAA